MIEAQGLTKYYGQIAAIEGLSFSVAKGEILGFLGPNAAGKSTTMRILTGYSPPTAGRAEIAGFDIATHPIEVKRRVGYLPESVPLYGEMVVSGFLRYVADIKGVSRGKQRSEAERVMERCGLTHMANRVIGNLSKGYRQRVGLAQALVGSPPVLILDEPTVGLDPAQIVEIRQVIRELAHEHTVLLSTHILPEVAMVCQRVLIIHRGRIVAQDTMANLAGASGLEVEAEGEPARVQAVFEAVPAVSAVVHQGGRHFFVTTDSDADLRPEIARAAVAGGLALLGMRRRTRSLEDVFMDAISAEEGVQA